MFDIGQGSLRGAAQGTDSFFFKMLTVCTNKLFHIPQWLKPAFCAIITDLSEK